MNCQALPDVLLNDKLNATHTRWCDSILPHQIVDVFHVPGRINVVADGISHKWEGLPRQVGDGSEWMVCKDWEVNTGLTSNIMHVSANDSTDTLWEHFKDKPMFAEVIDAMLAIKDSRSVHDWWQPQHWASQYLIEGDKLWQLKEGTAICGRAWVECVMKEEAKILAFQQHTEQGHWWCDSIKIALMDCIWCPGLDAIKDCLQCKNFGAAHIHSLFQPITQCHPFELLVSDYLSLPAGKGGFKTLGVFLNIFSKYIWTFKFKTAGSAKTTIDALQHIFQNFTASETFMTDGTMHYAHNGNAITMSYLPTPHG